MGPGENPTREALAFPDQPEQEMLGLDGDAAELTRFVAGEEQYTPRSFCVSLKHPPIQTGRTARTRRAPPHRDYRASPVGRQFWFLPNIKHLAGEPDGHTGLG